MSAAGSISHRAANLGRGRDSTDVAARPLLHLVNVVWGGEYTRLYLDVSLPSQLAPGNLPALERSADGVYRIFTTAEDATIIRPSPAYRRLQSITPTEIVTVEIPARTDPYETLTRLQMQALREAAAVGAYALLLAPDIVIADGGIDRLARLAAEGKKAVMVLSVRVAKESFAPELRRRLSQGPDAAVKISSADLVELAIKHFHPTSRALVWPPTTSWPSHLYWPVEDAGFIAAGFHLHPILVAPAKTDGLLGSTIDGDFVARNFSADEVHVVDDSTELTVFEMSSAAQAVGRPVAPLSASAVGRWAACNADEGHMRLFERSVTFRTGKPSSAWQAAHDSTAQISIEIRRYRSRFGWWGRTVNVLRPVVRLAKRCRRWPGRLVAKLISKSATEAAA